MAKTKTKTKHLLALKEGCARWDEVHFWFPGLLEPGLNGDGGLMREHWAQAGHRKKRLEGIVANLIRTGDLRAVKVPCLLVYTRRYARQPMDWDNAAASAKHLKDALVAFDVIPDDDPRYVFKFDVRQVKVKTEGEQGTAIDLFYLGNALVREAIDWHTNQRR